MNNLQRDWKPGVVNSINKYSGNFDPHVNRSIDLTAADTALRDDLLHLKSPGLIDSPRTWARSYVFTGCDPEAGGEEAE